MHIPNLILKLVNSNIQIKITETEERNHLIESIRTGKGDDFALITNDGSNYRISADFQYIINLLQKEKAIKLGYIDTVDSAIKETEEGIVDFTLIKRAVTKEEVIAKVRSGGVFPPKTTRHILPFRYQNIDTDFKTLF